MHSAKKLIKRFGTVRAFAWFFWLIMLVGHTPLWFKSLLGLIGGGFSGHLVSFLTLSVSSAFFIYKLCGLRVLPARPSWKRTVVYCLLGAVIHVFVFCPSLSVDRLELFAVVTVPTTIVVILALSSFEERLRKRLLRVSGCVFRPAEISIRSAYQAKTYVEWIRPCLQPIPLIVQPHHGPPVSRPVY